MKIETLEEKLYFFSGAFVAWSVLFLFVNYNLDLSSKLGKKKIDDIKNRIVSIFHGLFALVVTAYHIFRDQPQFTDSTTTIQHIIMLTSCAYFFYDFLACAYYGLVDMGLVLHHSMCLLGMLSCEYYDNATTGLMGLGMAEVSNFPMHFRVILRIFDMRYTKTYELAEILYIVSYAVARGLGTTWLVFAAVPVTSTPILIRLTCMGLWLQSLYFVYEMYGILKRKIRHFKEMSQKKISYNWFDDNPRLGELSFYRKEKKDKVF